jgi:hypothetical protein
VNYLEGTDLHENDIVLCHENTSHFYSTSKHFCTFIRCAKIAHHMNYLLLFFLIFPPTQRKDIHKSFRARFSLPFIYSYLLYLICTTGHSHMHHIGLIT